MVKVKRIFLVAALGACTSQTPSTPLSALATSQLEIVTNGQINIELHVDETQGCPVLGNDVVATFDGATMQVSRGGYDTNASGCYPIAFWFNDVPMATINGFEKVAPGSELVVTDKSATWTVDTVKLFANDFVVDTASSQIIWEDVSAVSVAQVSPGAVVGIEGNAIHYASALPIDSVYAVSHPTPTRCDGPGLCMVDLAGSRSFTASP